MFERDPCFVTENHDVTFTFIDLRFNKAFRILNTGQKRVNSRKRKDPSRYEIAVRRRGPARSYGVLSLAVTGDGYTSCRKRGSLSFSKLVCHV